jgi:hypothetical protein
MAKVGSYIHSSIHSGLTISVTNAYGTARKHQVNLADGQNYPNKEFQLGTLYLHVDTIAAGATSLTMRICRDAAGDQAVIGDTTATISTGITTATEGDATFLINSLYVHTDTLLYVFFKTNAGTCNVKKVELSFKE